MLLEKAQPGRVGVAQRVVEHVGAAIEVLQIVRLLHDRIGAEHATGHRVIKPAARPWAAGPVRTSLCGRSRLARQCRAPLRDRRSPIHVDQTGAVQVLVTGEAAIGPGIVRWGLDAGVDQHLPERVRRQRLATLWA